MTLARTIRRIAAVPLLRDRLNAANAWRLRGDDYEDPICGRTFSRLLPGRNGRPNAWCPRCYSAERHRLLWLFLERELAIASTPRRVLHVAPEAGIRRRLGGISLLDYVTTDLMDRRVTVRADLTALPFSNGSFDLVLCNHVLEHIPDDGAALAEISRVLAPSGEAVMQHPIDQSRATTFEDPTIVDPEERERVYLQRDHVRVYGRDFADRVRASEMRVEEVAYELRLSAAERRRYCVDQGASPSPEGNLEAGRIFVCRPCVDR